MNKPPEKRKPRTYKIADKPYAKAMKMAKKNKTTVSNLIEEWLTDYGDGLVIKSIAIVME